MKFVSSPFLGLFSAFGFSVLVVLIFSNVGCGALPDEVNDLRQDALDPTLDEPVPKPVVIKEEAEGCQVTEIDQGAQVTCGDDFVIVKHGKDGVDGKDGKDGAPGIDGKDAQQPEIQETSEASSGLVLCSDSANDWVTAILSDGAVVVFRECSGRLQEKQKLEYYEGSKYLKFDMEEVPNSDIWMVKNTVYVLTGARVLVLSSPSSSTLTKVNYWEVQPYEGDLSELKSNLLQAD